MSRRHSRVRIGKHGVIIIPKEIREELGLREGMVLDLEVEKNKNIIILKIKDLWGELRARGIKLRIDLDAAEKELDETGEF